MAQLPEWTYGDRSCTNKKDPINLVFERRGVPASQIVHILIGAAGWRQPTAATKQFIRDATNPTRGTPQHEQVTKGHIHDQYHVRLWDCQTCVVGSAHHEFGFTLFGTFSRPFVGMHFPHFPTSFEAGKWEVMDSFRTAGGWTLLRDDVLLNNFNRIPFHNGYATKIL